MKSRFEKLWRETAPPGSPCPQPEAREVLRRVNAALGAAPSERREPMKSNRRLRPVLAAVLAVSLPKLLHGRDCFGISLDDHGYILPELIIPGRIPALRL